MNKPNPVITALVRHTGPGIVGGMLCKWLENFSPSDIYNMAIQNKDKDAWEILPPEWKEKIKNFQGKVNILDQLNIDWAIMELHKGKRDDLASLIINTPEVAEFVSKIIADLQKGARA